MGPKTTIGSNPLTVNTEDDKTEKQDKKLGSSSLNQVIAEESSKEALLSDRQKETINMILRHPAFQFEDKDGQPFYTEEKTKELYGAIAGLMQRVESEHTELPIPKRIETILTEDEENFKFNSEYSDLSARTAYSLLCGEKKGSNCIGFAETCCILLDLNGYEATPVISRLNKKGVAPHYVTTFRDDDGKVRILDPERRRSCAEPEKLFNLTAYHASLAFTNPDDDFCANKIGASGIGPAFDEFFADKPAELVRRPIDQIGIVPGSDQDKAIHIFEEVEEGKKPRIELHESSMSDAKKAILDNAISKALEPIYAKSLQTMQKSTQPEANVGDIAV